MNNMVNSFHPQPITSIDQRRSSLRLFHKKPEIVWLLGEIQTFYTALRYDTAAVGLQMFSQNTLETCVFLLP